MKFLQDSAAMFFAVAVAVLSVIAILGIWDVFSADVITKSFETIGLLALVSVVVIVAGRFIDRRNMSDVPVPPSPVFRSVRQTTLIVLIVAAALLALLGVLAIWGVVAQKDILYKSVGSVATLAFGSLVIVMTCLEREGKLPKGGRSWGGGLLGVLVLFWLLISILSNMWR